MDTTHDNTQGNIIKRLSVWAAVVVAILMVPLLTNAPWTGSDYIFAGIVLSACATTYVLSTRKMSSIKHRAAVGAAILLFILLVMGWAATGP